MSLSPKDVASAALPEDASKTGACTPATPSTRRPSNVSEASTDFPEADTLSVSDGGWSASGRQFARRDFLGRLYKRLHDYYKGDKGKLTLFTIVILICSDMPIYFYSLLDALKLKALYKYRLHYDPSLASHLGARKYPPNDLLWKTLKGAEMNFFGAYVIPGALAIKLASKLGIFVYDTDEKEVNWRRILTESFKISILSDFFFYALHRFLHRDGWYIPYHKKHHTFKYTIAAAHHWMSFKEALLFALPQALPPIVLGALSGKKMHLLSMWIAFVFTQMNVISGHSGYQLPFIPKWFPTLQAEYHDFHHVDHMVNYGAIYPFTDWVFGTYVRAGVAYGLKDVMGSVCRGYPKIADMVYF